MGQKGSVELLNKHPNFTTSSEIVRFWILSLTMAIWLRSTKLQLPKYKLQIQLGSFGLQLMEIFIHTDLNNKDIFRKSRGSADFKAGYLAPSRALKNP